MDITQHLNDVVKARAEKRHNECKERLVSRMKMENPMRNPVYKAKQAEKMIGNQNARKNREDSADC